MLEAQILITPKSEDYTKKLADYLDQPNHQNTFESTLTFDDRQKSRHRATTRDGTVFGWFIERGHVLKEGDLLECQSGEIIKILSAPEQVSTVSAQISSHNPALDLTRAAYHLGNRHVPLQIAPDFLRYQHDHVLDDMVRGLGLNVTTEPAPFEPEPGAYAGGHQHNHGHHHEH